MRGKIKLSSLIILMGFSSSIMAQTFYCRCEPSRFVCGNGAEVGRDGETICGIPGTSLGRFLNGFPVGSLSNCRGETSLKSGWGCKETRCMDNEFPGASKYAKRRICDRNFRG